MQSRIATKHLSLLNFDTPRLKLQLKSSLFGKFLIRKEITHKKQKTVVLPGLTNLITSSFEQTDGLSRFIIELNGICQTDLTK